MWELGDGWMDKLLVIVGDGLTMERIRNFERDLRQKGRKFVEHFKMMEVFLAALSRVIKISGDLHFCFSFLGTVYIPFYQGFLQPIQALLGWKKIDATYIAQTYQTGSDFVFLVSGVCEKLLYDLFLYEMMPEEQAYASTLVADHPNAAAMFMALKFPKFLNKLRTGTDEVWCIIANFVYLARRFKKLRQSVHVGDSVMLEKASVDHNSVCLALGRHKYFAIGIDAIEQNYSVVDGEQLSFGRHNRTRRNHGGTTRDGKEPAHVPLDFNIEAHMPRYKLLGIDNSPEAMEEYSPDMPFCSRAHEFVTAEFGHIADAETVFSLLENNELPLNSDIGDKKKQTTIPRRTTEKIMSMEYLVLLTEGGKIVEGRKYTADYAWSKLGDVTTAFDESKNSSPSVPVPDVPDEVDEIQEMSNAMDIIYPVEGRQVAPEIQIDVEQGESFGVGDSLLDPNNEDKEETPLDAAGLESDELAPSNAINVPPSGRGRRAGSAVSSTCMKLKDGRKIKLPETRIISKFALKDWEQVGRKLMEDKNITAVRHRSKQRERREHELLSSSLYLSLSKDVSGDDDDEDPWENPSVDMSFRNIFRS
jgi:hypothetical protein